MSYIIQTWRDPYDTGVAMTSARQVELKPGVTILTGCNGSGKTTFLRNVEEQAREEHIPVYHFDGLTTNSRDTHIQQSLNSQDFPFLTSMITSSEGEGTVLSLCKAAAELRAFLQTGETKETKKRREWQNIFMTEEEKQDSLDTGRIRILLFDAIDSGYSIDNICELKNLFRDILEDARKMKREVYILAAANEYELVRGERCLDVSTGKEISFSDYEEYRTFILTSREKKEKRIRKERRGQNG